MIKFSRKMVKKKMIATFFGFQNKSDKELDRNCRAASKFFKKMRFFLLG